MRSAKAKGVDKGNMQQSGEQMSADGVFTGVSSSVRNTPQLSVVAVSYSFEVRGGGPRAQWRVRGV